MARRSLARLTFLSLFGLFAWTGAAVTAAPVTPIAQWQHTIFAAKDGAPAEIKAMAQDRDGFLWFGGSTGLFRFDGVSFDGSLTERLPQQSIMSLLAARDGSLWIGDRHGYITHVDHGKVAVYTLEGDKSTVMQFAERADGSLWAVTPRAAYRFDGAQWRNRKAGPFMQAIHAPDGSLFLLSRAPSDRTAWRLGPGEKDFVPSTIEVARDAVLGRKGTSWRPDTMIADEVADGEGTLWIGTETGIERLSWPGSGDSNEQPLKESYARVQGLGGAQALATLRDREGNLWVSTPATIEQFRLGKFRRLALPADSYLPAIAVDGRGHLWASRLNDTVMEFGSGSPRTWPGAGKRVGVAATGTDGSVLMVGSGGLVRMDGQTVAHIPLFPSIRAGDTGFRALAQARDGSVWVGIGPAYRHKDGDARLMGADTGLPDRPNHLWAIARRTDHGLWLAYNDNTLAMSEDDGSEARVFTTTDGIDVGHIYAIWPHDGGVWITGQRGVQFFHPGEPIANLRLRGGEVVREASGIVQRPDGSLWINTIHGLYRIDPASMAAWWRAHDSEVGYERFDERDGLQGVRDSRPAPSLVPGADGLLWIASDTGVASIDADRIPRNMIAPVAVVREINGERVDGPVELPAGNRRLEIAYSAPVLGVPTRAHFAYRLQGLETAWQDVGNIRHVSYTNLGPGTYRFELKAANEDGVWSRVPAAVDIRIAPFFYQSWWFRTLWGLALLGLLYLAYLWRLRSLGILICARLLERERIARDLHDTLLQSMQGVLLRVKVAADTIKEPETRDKLELALKATQDALVEGRRKIVGLRGTRGDASSLAERLQAYAAEVMADDAAVIAVSTAGQPRSLNPAAEDDIEAIVFELLSNAARHAQAQRVDVRITFARRRFEVEVRDDGKGMQGGRSGDRPSFGLIGIRERAEKLASRLTIRPRSPKGTQAMLRVPGPVAYWLPERTVARLRSRPWFR
jgi:ligand-binding sensor domain-containing protein/two-component sensor histidine kinase